MKVSLTWRNGPTAHELTMNEADICVIGGGPSGLTATKVLHQRQRQVDCYEKGSGIGGLWRYGNDNGMSGIYRSLHINTSRDETAFSDFPMPDDFPDFPHHARMLEYFESYIDHFGFRERIKLQTGVQQVVPADGGFDVTVETAHGTHETRHYGHVLVANGHHWLPRWPEFPGSFDGHALHSHQYRTPDELAGNRVLVVGMGNSGCDIACESSRVAARTMLSTRRGAHIIPKYLFGCPLDSVCPAWMWRFVPMPLFRPVFRTIVWLNQGSLSYYGLPTPEHKVLEEHPTISSDLPNLVGHGDIVLKPNIERLAGNQVEFADGSREDVDVIVYATGYKIAFPFLDESLMQVKENAVGLYRHVVHPQVPGLYFIGLVQPWGSILPLAEAQSQWVADLIDGKCGLPTVDAMQKAINRDLRKIRRRYTHSPRHTIQVDFHPYLAQLRRERRRPPAQRKPAPAPAAAEMSSSQMP